MSTVLLDAPALSLVPKENYKSLTLQNKLTNLKPKLKDLELTFMSQYQTISN